MSENKWTKANRLTKVVSHRVVEGVVGSSPGYSVEALAKQGVANVCDGDKFWLVWTTCLTGLDKETIGCGSYATEREALEAVAEMPVGMVFGDGVGWPCRFKDMFEGRDAQRIMSFMFACGEDDAVDFVCYDAFYEAGIHETKFGELSQGVISWLGDEHVIWMKEEFGENWQCVAAFEYVLNHFPDSSLVGLAAKLFLARFITYDGFVAGYLVKEIQTIAGGTEAAALSSVEAKRKAGLSGGRASNRRRLKNLEIFMLEIEALSGAVGIISEQLILQQARERAVEKFKIKSKSTLDDYETSLRTEEPFKARYEAVFSGKNA